MAPSIPNQKQEKRWQYNAPVGHVLSLSKKPKDLLHCYALSHLTRVCLRKMCGGVGVAHCVFDGNAMKVYLGPIVCGLSLAMPLLLKGTAT